MFFIALGENIQTINKVTINMISKRSLNNGFTPNTLRDADKKYINIMKLKPWKDLIDNLLPIYIKIAKGIDQKTKKKNVAQKKKLKLKKRAGKKKNVAWIQKLVEKNAVHKRIQKKS